MVKKRDRKKRARTEDTKPVVRRSGLKIPFDYALPVLYAAIYVIVLLFVHLEYFPIGDIGVETDFYGDLVVAAQEIWKGNFSVGNYPYKGPIYSFVLVFVHLFGGDWYRGAVVLNLICAALSLIVVYRLVMRLFNRGVALFTMISVSFVLEFFLQAHKASSDMLFFLLCYISISLIIMEKLSWRRVIAAALLSALAFLTRYNGIFIPACAFFIFLLIDPGKWSWKSRLSAYVLYLGVFIVACSWWFILNYLEEGSILVTRNLENIVEEFYSGTRSSEIPEGGFRSVSQLFINDPVYFITHFVTNIPKRFWNDMQNTLGIKWLFIVLPGMLRLLIVPPNRKQWAFLLFPIGIFLATCTVFYLPRFSIPVTPLYFAIGYSFVFGSGDERRSLLGNSFERKFLGYLRWIRQDLQIFIPRLTRARVVVLIIICFLFTYQIRWLVAADKEYYNRRPLFIFDSARFIKENHAMSGKSEPPVIMARKPHIAYYSGGKYQVYPKDPSAATDYLTYAVTNRVEYIVYSDIEKLFYPSQNILIRLDQSPGVSKIYEKPEIIIYRLDEWLDISTGAGMNLLLGHLNNLRKAEESNDYEMIIKVSREIAGIYTLNGKWNEVEKYFLVSLRAAEQITDRKIANQYRYPDRRNLSGVYLKLGKHEEGIALLLGDLEIFERRGNKRQVANIHFNLALHYRALKKREIALDHLLKAYDIYDTIGDSANAEAVQIWIKNVRAGR